MARKLSKEQIDALAEKNRKYWADREDEALKHYIKDEKEYDRQIEKIYRDMLDGVQKEIDGFYGRYAKKEGISINEAKKRVTEADIKAYERKAKRYVRDKDFSKQANEEMRLYNLTMKVNRLEMLKANIGLDLIKGHDELEKYMAEILQGRTTEELERQAGILGNTITINSKMAHAIPNSSFHNARFSDRIWAHQDLLKADLSKLLQTGLIQGKNPRVLARELESKFNTSRYNAERLMRTELARVQTEVQKASLERNGFTQFEFLANSKCCDICQEKHKKIFKLDGFKYGDNAPPLHPHCRCAIAPYEDTTEFDAWLDHVGSGGGTTWADWQKTNNKEFYIDDKWSQVRFDNDDYMPSVKDYLTDPESKQMLDDEYEKYQKRLSNNPNSVIAKARISEFEEFFKQVKKAESESWVTSSEKSKLIADKKNAELVKIATQKESVKKQTEKMFGDYKQIEQNHTLYDDAKAANPNYTTLTYEYTNNCQRCVPAWEARRRGLDVEAMPMLSHTDNFTWTNPYHNPVVENGKLSDVTQSLLGWGDGARAEIRVTFDNLGNGHVFAAENVNGKVVYIDPQSGITGDYVEEYFDRAIGEASYIRTDTLEFDEDFIERVVKGADD
jgi:SPP1 gp7 family putative phage head morphogenesis protein